MSTALRIAPLIFVAAVFQVGAVAEHAVEVGRDLPPVAAVELLLRLALAGEATADQIRLVGQCAPGSRVGGLVAAAVAPH